ncbi:MAG: hypothetical protein ACRDAX_08375 [Propionibacteriaceae bacterium]
MSVVGDPAVALEQMRARSLVRQMLTGKAAVTLTAYQRGEALTSVLHGLSKTGDFIVVDFVEMHECSGAFCSYDPIEVRVDLYKDSAEIMLPMQVASAHMLGQLQWYSHEADIDNLQLRDDLSQAISDFPGYVRVGVIAAERIILHDVDGVSSFNFAELDTAIVDGDATAESFLDQMYAAGRESMALVSDAVIAGLVPGTVSLLAISDDVCAELEQSYCLDVTVSGVTLLRLTERAAYAVFIPVDLSCEADLLPDAWRQLIVDAEMSRRAYMAH